MVQMSPEQLLRLMLREALDAVRPDLCIPPFLPPDDGRPLVVLGCGKASASMARAVEDIWKGPISGLVVTRYGHSVACRKIRVIEAAHPTPDASSFHAGMELLHLAEGLAAGDRALCLISGGGSSLACVPRAGVEPDEKRAINSALLRSGADIREMNCVRRHLSEFKGGQLAAACWPAEVTTLVISDVAGDAPVDIASGPTVGDPTSCADALEILNRYGVAISSHIRAKLTSGEFETMKPGDVRLASARTEVIASGRHALAAAAKCAADHRVSPIVLGDRVEGEAREVAKALAGIALSVADGHLLMKPPCVLLSGGETTVTVRGDGEGGRNVEFLLALAIALGGAEGVYALAADTDGVDGALPVAGAIIDPMTLPRLSELGIHPRGSLDRNDCHPVFAADGRQVVTGPTLNNVNDFRAILIM